MTESVGVCVGVRGRQRRRGGGDESVCEWVGWGG